MPKYESCELLNAKRILLKGPSGASKVREVSCSGERKKKQNFSKETDSGELFQCSDFHNKARM